MASINLLGPKVILGKLGVCGVVSDTWGNESVPLMYIIINKSAYIR